MAATRKFQIGGEFEVSRLGSRDVAILTGAKAAGRVIALSDPQRGEMGERW